MIATIGGWRKSASRNCASRETCLIFRQSLNPLVLYLGKATPQRDSNGRLYSSTTGSQFTRERTRNGTYGEFGSGSTDGKRVSCRRSRESQIAGQAVSSGRPENS